MQVSMKITGWNLVDRSYSNDELNKLFQEWNYVREPSKISQEFHEGFDSMMKGRKLFLSGVGNSKTPLLKNNVPDLTARKLDVMLVVEEMRKHKCILEVRLLSVFQELESYWKNVADAIRIAIRAKGATEIKDSLTELRWELKQAERLKEPLEKAKEACGSLRGKITELSEKRGVDLSFLSQMDLDETAEKKIIASLDDVFKHLQKAAIKMQNIGFELDLLSELQGQIEEMTQHQDIHGAFFKRRGRIKV